MPPVLQVVFGKHQFDAEEPDEISFQVGEPVLVIEKDENYNDGWWKGQNAKGQVGLFPRNFITDKNIANVPVPFLKHKESQQSLYSMPEVEIALLDQKMAVPDQNPKTIPQEQTLIAPQVPIKDVLPPIQEPIEEVVLDPISDDPAAYSITQQPIFQDSVPLSETQDETSGYSVFGEPVPEHIATEALSKPTFSNLVIPNPPSDEPPVYQVVTEEPKEQVSEKPADITTKGLEASMETLVDQAEQVEPLAENPEFSDTDSEGEKPQLVHKISASFMRTERNIKGLSEFTVSDYYFDTEELESNFPLAQSAQQTQQKPRQPSPLQPVQQEVSPVETIGRKQTFGWFRRGSRDESQLPFDLSTADHSGIVYIKRDEDFITKKRYGVIKDFQFFIVKSREDPTVIQYLSLKKGGFQVKPNPELPKASFGFVLEFADAVVKIGVPSQLDLVSWINAVIKAGNEQHRPMPLQPVKTERAHSPSYLSPTLGMKSANLGSPTSTLSSGQRDSLMMPKAKFTPSLSTLSLSRNNSKVLANSPDSTTSN
ncbi:hypothetical protein EDD86DRAFT_196519 [Gorgonomyces haynaldii]|nr:hypothetical protein EDD86DRAFT_196519 [Gorgonomyces haynaldii]